MTSSTTASRAERRYRFVARGLFVVTTMLVFIIVASVPVTLGGRGVFKAEPGPFGEDGWRDRSFGIGGGTLVYSSSSYLGFQGDHSGVPPFKVRTGVWLVTDESRLGMRWVPSVGLDSLFYGSFPLWMVAVPLLVGGVVCQRAANRRRQVRMAGLCPGCGYDLRATPDRCPECGAIANAPVTSP